MIAFTFYSLKSFSEDVNPSSVVNADIEAKKMLDTEIIRSPYYSKILYRSLKEEAEKNNQNKTEIMSVLKQTMNYSEEELKELSENFEKNPPINYNPDKVNSEQRMALIKSNPVEAFYQLSVQKELNPSFFKTLEQTERKYESSFSTVSTVKPSKALEASSIIPLSVRQKEIKRLGKKSFKINPDLFY